MRNAIYCGCLLMGVLVVQMPVGAQDSQPVRPAVTSRPTSQPTSQAASGPVNLLFNGDFSIAAEGGILPAGWTTKHPDNVRLMKYSGKHRRAIRMTGDKKLMASYGVDLTSEPIPIKANTRYRCTGYTKSDGPAMKVFVKGYATVTRRVDGELRTFDDIVYQMRKDIEPYERWQPFNLDFEIVPTDVFSDFQHEIKYVRVRLWAYWPEGTCWFADMRFEETGSVPADERWHDEAMTHMGRPPRLSKAAVQPNPTETAFDEEQAWHDAVNAFRAERHEQAAGLAEQLIEHAPHKGTYRVLAARALAGFERWKDAEQHALWLVEPADEQSGKRTPAREIESWQRDWANVVLAQVYVHTGRRDAARKELTELLKRDISPHARAAAEKLQAELDSEGD